MPDENNLGFILFLVSKNSNLASYLQVRFSNIDLLVKTKLSKISLIGNRLAYKFSKSSLKLFYSLLDKNFCS